MTADSSLDLKRTFCPVGKLLPYVNVFVLDEKMEDVPPGVQGEVFVVARRSVLTYGVVLKYLTLGTKISNVIDLACFLLSYDVC